MEKDNTKLTGWGQHVEAKRKEYQIPVTRFTASLGIARSHYYRLITGASPIALEQKEQIEDMLERLNPDSPLSLLIDYMRVRIPTCEQVTLRTVCESVLKMPLEAFQASGRGLYGYDNSYVCGNLIIFTSQKEELGILIEMKGLGCRQYEVHLNYREETWFEFWERCILYDGVFKRVDLAVNDHYGILNISHLIDRCKNGECISKSRKFSDCGSGELRFEKPDMGRTLYVGTRQSEIYFCIYEKDYEQWTQNGIPIDEAVTKNRFEIRLSDDRAAECIRQFLEYRYDADCAEIVTFGIINQYIRFCVRPKGDYSGKKQDWDLDVMWEHFIGEHRSRLRLAMEPKPFSKLRTLNWLSRQCMPTVKGLLMEDVKNGESIIVDMINAAEPGYKLSKVLSLEKKMYNQIKVDLDEKGRVMIC